MQCKYEGCGKIISSISNLSRHYLVHTGVKPYECKYCKRRFNQRVNLTKHERGHEASFHQDHRAREFYEAKLNASTQPLSVPQFMPYAQPFIPTVPGVMPAYYIMDPTIALLSPFYNINSSFIPSPTMLEAISMLKEGKLDYCNKGAATPMPIREENARDDDDFNVAVDYLCENLAENDVGPTSNTNIFGPIMQNMHGNNKFKNIRQIATSANNMNLSI